MLWNMCTSKSRDKRCEKKSSQFSKGDVSVRKTLIISSDNKVNNCSKMFQSRRKRLFGWRTVWPDLAKFRHFGNENKILGNSLWVYFVRVKILNILWIIFMLLANVHCCKWPNIEKYNLAIWSHWWRIKVEKNKFLHLQSLSLFL